MKGDAIQALAEIKQQEGRDILMYGSGAPMQSLPRMAWSISWTS